MIYSKLFASGKIGSMELKNKIILSAMGYEIIINVKDPSPKLIDSHVTSVKNECRLNIVEFTATNHSTKNPIALDIYDDSFIPELSKIADVIRKTGKKSSIQIWNRRPVVSKPINETTPNELKIGEIYKLIESYGDACLRAKKAGFDSVELQCAQGHLLYEFMSKACNKRTDKFGGSFENRIKFPLMVINSVREKVGPDFPIIYRINYDELCEDGITLEDVTEFAKLSQYAGVDALYVSYNTTKKLKYIVPPIYELKKYLNIPVIAVGKIDDPLIAEKMLNKLKVDFIEISIDKFDEVVKFIGYI